MHPEVIKELERIADKKPDVEQCGVIDGSSIFVLPNVHKNPTQHFMLSPEDVVGYGKKDVVIWHSHTPEGYPQLTVPDVVAAKFWGKPILMIQAKTHHRDYYDPREVLPYQGRQFRYAHRNCWTLAQDYYRHEFGLILPDFFPDNDTEFFSDAPSKFLKNLGRNGFAPVDPNDLRIGDLLLTNEEGQSKAWHCSVLTTLSPIKMVLSQWVTRPSGFIPYRAISKRVHSAWRHSDVN